MSADEDLRRLSESVVLYEFEMLSKTVHRSMEILTRQVKAEWWEENAFLESALLHARQLVEFFFRAGFSRGRCSRQ